MDAGVGVSVAVHDPVMDKVTFWDGLVVGLAVCVGVALSAHVQAYSTSISREGQRPPHSVRQTDALLLEGPCEKMGMRADG